MNSEGSIEGAPHAGADSVAIGNSLASVDEKQIVIDIAEISRPAEPPTTERIGPKFNCAICICEIPLTENIMFNSKTHDICSTCFKLFLNTEINSAKVDQQRECSVTDW